jgi:glycosyltransferase involved in cell wall biosynthesis
VESEQVYAADSSFTVPMGDKVRLFWRLFSRTLPVVAHFFFSPNPPTSRAARLIRMRHPGTTFVQTLMSLPEHPAALAAGIFADVVVTWSRAATDLVRGAVGHRARPPRVIHIPPGVTELTPMSRDERRIARGGFGLPSDRPVVLFAGDLEFSTAAETTAAAIHEVLETVDATFVFACRPKTPAARGVLELIQNRLAAQRESGRVVFLGDVQRFHDLLRCVDCQVLPAETTYAKTDLPMVVLEGLTAGVPAIVGTGTPMDELVEAGAVLGVPPSSPGVLAARLAGLLSGPGRTEALGRNGRMHALKHHTADAMARAHMALYRELVRFR